YFYYEIVRRRYPGTTYFDKATERMHELKSAVEKEQQQAAVPAKPVLPKPRLFEKARPPAQVLPAPSETTPRPDDGSVVPGTMLMRPAQGGAPQTLPADLTGHPQ